MVKCFVTKVTEMYSIKKSFKIEFKIETGILDI